MHNFEEHGEYNIGEYKIGIILLGKFAIISNIKDPFRSKMVEDTPYIERPYNQIDPDNLLEKR